MLRQFLKDSAIYGAAGVLVRGVSILLVPLYTHVLAPEDYGLVDILAVFSGFVAVTVALEISQAVARFFPDTDDLHARQGYASTALWYAVAAYTGFLAIAFVIASPASLALLEREERAEVFRVAVAATWLSGLFYLVQSQLRYSRKPRQHAIASLVFSFVSIATSALFVLFLRQGVIGVFFGQVAGGTAGLTAALLYSRDVYRMRFDRDKLSEMLRFSLPLIPSSVAVILMLYVDRIVINRLMTLGDVGLFGIGYRLSSLTTLLMVGFVSALTPLIYAHYREPGTPRELARIFRIFTALALFVCLGLALFARDLLTWFTTPEYVPSAVVVPLLAPALLLGSMYVFAPGLGIAKDTRMISTINIGAAVLNTVLSLLLVPVLGIMGAAAATLVSSATVFGANMVVSQRLYPVPHDWRRLGLAVAASVFLFVLGNAIPVGGSAGIALRAGLLFAAMVWFVMIGLIDASDLARTVRSMGRPPTTDDPGQATSRPDVEG